MFPSKVEARHYAHLRSPPVRARGHAGMLISSMSMSIGRESWCEARVLTCNELHMYPSVPVALM